MYFFNQTPVFLVKRGLEADQIWTFPVHNMHPSTRDGPEPVHSTYLLNLFIPSGT